MIYYAIGDIHGMYDQLVSIMKKIEDFHDTVYNGREYKVVFLGDYVDRGPESQKCIDFINGFYTDHIVLPGNHEEMFYGVIENEQDASYHEYMMWWGRNGGFSTYGSYFPLDHPVHDPDNWKSLMNCREWKREFVRNHPDHVEFLKKCLQGDFSPNHTIHHIDYDDRIMFVHAGVVPNKPLAQHNNRELMWSRLVPFLHMDEEWVEPSVDLVVHGHTPEQENNVRQFRVGLDAGAYRFGKLIAGVFEDGKLVHQLEAIGEPANFIPPAQFNQY